MTAIAALILLDLAAISLLVFGVYYPRHHRSDLVVAFLGVNIGVLAVTEMLAASTVGAGLGIGLFGVLSIIRLRSTEISQREVAYYFASLAIGLIAGLSGSVTYITAGLIALIVAVLAASDSTRLFGETTTEDVQLDRAIADPQELKAELARLLRAQVLTVTVLKLDLVNDLTHVSVRVKRSSTSSAARRAAAAPQELGMSAPTQQHAPAQAQLPSSSQVNR